MADLAEMIGGGELTLPQAQEQIERLRSDAELRSTEMARRSTEMAALRRDYRLLAERKAQLEGALAASEAGLAASEARLAEQEAVGDADGVDRDLAYDSAAAAVNRIRGIGNRATRLMSFSVFAQLLKDSEQDAVRRVLPQREAVDFEQEVLNRLSFEVEAYQGQAGITVNEAFEKIFDESGLPKKMNVEAELKLLKFPRLGPTTPLDEPPVESLLSKVLAAILVSPSYRTKTIYAEKALKVGRPYRFDYRKSGDGQYINPELQGQELVDFVQRRKSRIEGLMLIFAGFIVTRSSGGTATTQAGLLGSLALVWISRMSHLGSSFASSMGITASSTTVDKVREKIASSYAAKVFVQIALLVVAYQSWGMLFITDNYALLRWAAHLQHGSPFTSCSDTMTFMVKPLRGPPLNRDPGRPAAMPPSFDAVRLLKFYATHSGLFCPTSSTMTPNPAAAGVFSTAAFPADRSVGCASLFDFFPLPSLAAKSSKITDLLHIVMVGILNVMAKVGLTDADVFVLVDGEPALLFDKAARLVYEKVNMVCVLLAVFHLQKHLLEASFVDPENFQNF